MCNLALSFSLKKQLIAFMIFCLCLLNWNNALYPVQGGKLLTNAKNNNAELLKVLQQYGGHPNYPALNRALEESDINAAISLLNYGVEVNKRNPSTSIYIDSSSGSSLYNDGETALEIALEKNLLSIIPLLLEKGANPYLIRNLQYSVIKPNFCSNPRDTTFISEAIMNNKLDIILLLHSHNINMDLVCFSKSQACYTPLQFALSYNRSDIASFLISIGAKLELP